MQNKIRFFMKMQSPTATHQMKKVKIVKGKPVFYEPAKVKDARAKFKAHLAKHIPDEPFTCGIRLITKWCYEKGPHENGEYKITKPDTDNMVKLLKDVMTDLNFWTDDCLVASEVIEKFWSEVPGVYVSIEKL